MSKLDALVVLGCRVGERGRLSAGAERRVRRAIVAYKGVPDPGDAPLMVFSGGRRWHGVAEADAFRRFAISQGVPESSTLRELKSLTTRENALFSTRLLEELGVQRVGIVTCDWHLPRALRCFGGRGLEIVGLPAESPTSTSASKKWARRLLEQGRSRLW